MVILITTVAGLAGWIVMWAVGIKAVDAMLYVLLLVVIAVGIQRMIGSLRRRRSDASARSSSGSAVATGRSRFAG